MTTLRFLIIPLLVLNALAFSALRGWLGSAPPAGEPGRIASQLNPERIRLAREVAPPRRTRRSVRWRPISPASELPPQNGWHAR